MKTQHTRLVLTILSVLFVAFLINTLFFASGLEIGSFHRWVEEPHFGKITEIHKGTFIIENRETRKEIILVGKETAVRQGRQVVTEESLQVGMQVIVVGIINSNGQIEATVIRIFPDGNPNNE